MNGWHRALDVQMDQHKWQLTETGATITQYFFESILEKLPHVYPDGTEYTPDQDALVINKNLITTLWRADTMYITADMQHLLMQASHDLPDDVTFDTRTLISESGFCLFEETIYGQDLNNETMGISALAWHVGPIERTDPNSEPRKAIVVYWFTSTDDEGDDINKKTIPEMRAAGLPIGPLAVCHFYPILDGQELPKWDKPENQMVLAQLRLFAALHLLAQQRIGEPMKMRPERHTRKRAAKWDMNNERYITLITLRRKSPPKHDDEVNHIDWSHRWVVKGHWRRQYYPSTKTHDWVYIFEHVKGPEDKPLIIKERRVFNFRR